MDSFLIALLAGLLGLLIGFVLGSRYRQHRMEGATRPQALRAMLIGGGGGPPADP